jgi:hypothetical protein
MWFVIALSFLAAFVSLWAYAWHRESRTMRRAENEARLNDMVRRWGRE